MAILEDPTTVFFLSYLSLLENCEMFGVSIVTGPSVKIIPPLVIILEHR